MSFLLAIIIIILPLAILLGIAWVRAPDRLQAALNFVRSTTPTPPAAEATLDPNLTETPTPRRTSTPRQTRTPVPSPSLMPTATPINVVQHFLIGRPVQTNAVGAIPDWTYLYGTTRQGEQAVHHGEEFVNPIGTPLVAVADAVVVVAGDDQDPLCGPAGDEICGEAPDFYGKLVVLKLDQAYGDQAVFTTYGHMSRIDVTPGQHVRAGDTIGTVGDTGVAEGPHVHFEVRLGVNDYAHTRNPILWMRPLPGAGSIAGIVQDRNGNPLRGVNVILYLDNASQDYNSETVTYGRDEHPLVNSDDQLHENFAMPDVPAGKYILRAQVGGLYYLRHITVENGKLLFVALGGL